MPNVVVEVRLFAYFRDNRFKKKNMEFNEGPQIKQILDVLEIPSEEVAIILKNGQDAKPETFMENGDVLSLFPPVGGG